jgi:hypothetical protein
LRDLGGLVVDTAIERQMIGQRERHQVELVGGGRDVLGAPLAEHLLVGDRGGDEKRD